MLETMLVALTFVYNLSIQVIRLVQKTVTYKFRYATFYFRLMVSSEYKLKFIQVNYQYFLVSITFLLHVWHMKFGNSFGVLVLSLKVSGKLMESFSFLSENNNAQDALTSWFGQAPKEVIVIHYHAVKDCCLMKQKVMC